ncbi:erythromycin resistance leader peptide [Heyndrickxia oleronia]
MTHTMRLRFPALNK